MLTQAIYITSVGILSIYIRVYQSLRQDRQWDSTLSFYSNWPLKESIPWHNIMIMNKILKKSIPAWFILGNLMLLSCEKTDEPNEPRHYVDIDINEQYLTEGIHFDYNTNDSVITFSTGKFVIPCKVSLSSKMNEEWCNIEYSNKIGSGGRIRISVKENSDYMKSRNTALTIQLDSTNIDPAYIDPAFIECSKTVYEIPIIQQGNFVDFNGTTLQVYVEEGETLSHSFHRGDNFIWPYVESMIVEGSLHKEDFETICEYGHGKKLHYLDISNAIFPERIIIPGYCFHRDWPNLHTMILSPSIDSIGYCAFYGSPSLETVVIPESDKKLSLDSHIFGECFNLSTVILPNSIEEIKQYTFYNCTNLKRITIPASVKEIHTSTFIGCSALTELHFLSETPPNISDFPHFLCNQYKTENHYIVGGDPLRVNIYVPAGCEESYRNSVWAKNAINIIGE